MREFIRHSADIPIEIIRDAEVQHTRHALENIGLGGLLCHFDEKIEVGSAIKIRIDLVKPDFEIMGRVVWCNKLDTSYEIGVEFDGEKDTFKLRMIEQICHIEHYRKEVKELESRDLTGEEAAQEWIVKYASNFP